MRTSRRSGDRDQPVGDNDPVDDQDARRFDFVGVELIVPTRHQAALDSSCWVVALLSRPLNSWGLSVWSHVCWEASLGSFPRQVHGIRCVASQLSSGRPE